MIIMLLLLFAAGALLLAWQQDRIEGWMMGTGLFAVVIVMTVHLGYHVNQLLMAFWRTP
jgi:membrane protein YdbS with pleckstrin-like domain